MTLRLALIFIAFILLIGCAKAECEDSDKPILLGYVRIVYAAHKSMQMWVPSGKEVYWSLKDCAKEADPNEQCITLIGHMPSDPPAGIVRRPDPDAR